MSRHQFRLLVVLHQSLIFGALVVYDMTAGALPPEIAQFLDTGGSVVEEPADSGGWWLRSFDDWLYYGLTLMSLVASLGLCLLKKWGRTLFLLCTVILVLTSPFSEFYVSTGWSALLNYLATLLEGMIIALVYFSHVRKLFAPMTAEA